MVVSNFSIANSPYNQDISKSVPAIPKVFLQEDTPNAKKIIVTNGNETETCTLDDQTCGISSTSNEPVSQVTTETYLTNLTHVRRLSMNSMVGGVLNEGKCLSPKSPKASPLYKYFKNFEL